MKARGDECHKGQISTEEKHSAMWLEWREKTIHSINRGGEPVRNISSKNRKFDVTDETNREYFFVLRFENFFPIFNSKSVRIMLLCTTIKKRLIVKFRLRKIFLSPEF